MIKALLKTAFILTVALACGHAFADNGSMNFPSTGLNPSSNDQSRYFLGVIFGQVGDVLNGTGGQILGTMFNELNKALLILGTIIFTYVYGKGILDTAAHGEFLGKQANSLWVPLRSVGGLALMIPKASTGYCVIQVFMMWVVLQGVGAADMIWNTLANKVLNNSKGAATASSIVSTSIAAAQVQHVQQVFSSLVCGYSLQKIQNGGGFRADFSTDGNSRAFYINYYGAPGTIPVSCGKISWTNDCSNSDSKCQRLADQQKREISNIITNLEPIARYYVDDSYRFCNERNNKGVCTAPAFPKSLNDGGNNGEVAKHVYNFAQDTNFPATQAENYVASLAGDKDSQRNNDPSKATGNDMVDNGWIYAGSYIYLIAKATNANGTIPTFNAAATSINTLSDYFPMKYPDPMGASTQFTQNLPSDKSPQGSHSSGDVEAFEALTGIVAAGTGIAATVLGVSGAPSVGVALGTLSIVSAIFTGVLHAISVNSSPLGVLLILQSFGYAILGLIAIAFGVMIGALFAEGMAENIMNCMQPVGYAAGNVLSYLSYMIMAMFGGMVTMGVFLAVYLPMLPFIFFTFGVLSWLVAVIETMIAAPIVALGIIHPEGHDFWGKAEPAVLLTVNVFLRPSLMLFGLMSAILVSYVFVDIITVGFSLALTNMQDSGVSMLNPIQSLATMALYVFLIVTAYTQCFKLINELGNRILSWLGFQGQLGLNTDEATGQMRQNASTIGGTASQAFKEGDAKVRDKARSIKQNKADAKKLSMGQDTTPSNQQSNPSSGGGRPDMQNMNFDP